MLCVVLAGCLAAFPPGQEPRKRVEAESLPPATTTADRVTLRDGKVVLGLITSPAAGPKVGFDMLVRRAWAEEHVPELAAKWGRNAETMRKPAVAERKRRLEAWRAERLRAVGGDRVTAWIDGELKRLDDPTALDAPLFSVRIGRDGCRSAERNSDAARKALALAWLSGLPDPEGWTPGDVRDGVEARGFVVDDGAGMPSLDRLVPIATEPEAKWLARRAATELAVDEGRRFIRYESLLLPDPTDGVPLDTTLDLNAALGQIGRLLDPNAGAADPLIPALEKIASQGGAGAVVTRLETAPDLSRVGVDISLWVRGPRGWTNYGSRNAVVRPEDVAPAVADQVGQDPQVQQVFSIADALGLGAVTAEMKERSLRMGAATGRALGQARSAFSQELRALELPVREPAPKPAEPGK